MSYKRFDTEDIVVSSDSITSAAWSDNVPTLTSFFTSSIQKNGSSGKYYMSVFNGNPITSTSASVQFEAAYCDSLGSGSEFFNDLVPFLSPTRTNFGQYRTLVLEDENSSFKFGSETNIVTGSNFWAISVERSRYKEKLLPGTLNLHLSASGGKIKLTDDSKEVLVNTFIGAQRAFQLISGSNGESYDTSNGYVAGSGSYGLFLPDIATILINPLATSQSINLEASQSYDSPGLNNDAIYNAIRLGGNFQVNSQETVSSDFVFVRLRNSEFNYTENPSFISGSTGEVIYSDFINQPQVFLTTVGMYNDSNELLAVAKLSRPLLKDFTKEALIRVKLDF
tara:strand:+ start:12194 stop:13207 length:1014 start_codon:yes stop_codon:yes gene_type:complete